MAVIQVQKIPKKTESALETLARFCFYFPQYTLQEARRLPAKDVNLLLKAARKEQARKMYEFTQIIASPHTTKGAGVKKMLKYFKELMED